MQKIKVAVCDDQQTICQYYKNIIDNTPNMEFVGKAYTSLECLKMVEQTKPNVLLLDLQLEYHEAGFEITPKIKQISPKTKILMLTMHGEYTNLLNAKSLQIDCFMQKDFSDEELVETIENLFSASNSFLQEQFNQKLIEGGIKLAEENKSLLYYMTIMKSLTKAEIEILHDLCDDMSYEEISKKRFVTENTVRSQIVRIVRKTKSSNIRELVDTANELKIFKLFDME